MTAQTEAMVMVDIHVSTDQPTSDDLFHTRATQLMDELMPLSECNPEAAGPVVNSNAQKSVLTVEILIFTDDQIEAINKALTVLRTGLHAAGAQTAGWPSIERLENRTELMPDLLSPWPLAPLVLALCPPHPLAASHALVTWLAETHPSFPRDLATRSNFGAFFATGSKITGRGRRERVRLSTAWEKSLASTLTAPHAGDMNPPEPQQELHAPAQTGPATPRNPADTPHRTHQRPTTRGTRGTRGTRTVPGAALAIAARQHGVLSWSQASSTGVTKSDARRLVRNGEWGRPYTGVYSVRTLTPPSGSESHLRTAAMAAQLALGPNAFVGGETAARLWGMQGLPLWDRRTIHMVIPAIGAQRHHHRITLHSWPTSPEEVTTLHGIRLTDPGRTLRDTLLRVDRETAICLMDSVLNQGLVRNDDIEELELANRGRRGCVNVRRWWRLADGRAESPLETRVRLICVDGGMPPTDLQRRFLDGRGRTIGIADFWWEEHQLIGEADGLGPHSLPQALLRDRERQNALQRWHPGVRIARFTWQDLKRPQYILASIARPGG